DRARGGVEAQSLRQTRRPEADGAAPARGGPLVPVDGPHLAVVEEAGRELEGGGGRLHEERDHLDDLVVLARVVAREPAEESHGGQGRPRPDRKRRSLNSRRKTR